MYVTTFNYSGLQSVKNSNYCEISLTSYPLLKEFTEELSLILTFTPSTLLISKDKFLTDLNLTTGTKVVPIPNKSKYHFKSFRPHNSDQSRIKHEVIDLLPKNLIVSQLKYRHIFS